MFSELDASIKGNNALFRGTDRCLGSSAMVSPARR